MILNTENFNWGRKALEDLGHLPGAPRTEAQWNSAVKAFIRIVHNRVMVHKDLGTLNDAEWLLQQAADACDRFPSAIQLRMLYEERFAPADGKSSGMLTEALP